MLRVAVDTNIILDILLPRKGSTDAQQIFELARLNRLQLFCAVHSLTNTWYVTSESLGIRQRVVRNKLAALLNFITILDITKEAVSNSLVHSNRDFEDTTILYAAHENKCDLVVTNNKAMLRSDIIKAVNPATLLGIISN